MKPAILYAAKSTADKNDSIPAQLKEGRSEAEAGGWTVVDFFSDENKSAYKGNRGDELAKAQRLAEELAAAHGECAMFIQHSDRLARGDGIQARHLVEYALWAIKSGVKIVSKQDPQTFADLLYAVVTGQRNHEDSKRKSESVRGGIGRRVTAKGLPTGGGHRRFGYQWTDTREGGVEVVRFEAEVVEHRMYRPTLEGVSGMQIMRELEADRIKTVTGGRWHQSTVSKILRSAFYKGVIVYQGEEFQGVHKAIIEPDLWQEVADFLAARKTYGRPKGQGRAPAGKHLFRKGTLTCICGGAMSPKTVKRTLKSGEVAVYENYECSEHHRDSNACPVTSIRRELIDTPAFRYFERVGLDLEATRAQLAASQEGQLERTRSLLAEAQRDADKTRASLERVERDYLEGTIDAAAWNRFSAKLQDDLEVEERQVEQLAAQVEEVATSDEVRDLEEEVVKKLAAIRAAIAGEITSASGAEAVRAAILRLFEGFALREPSLDLNIPSELAWVDRFVMEPRVREGVIPEGTLPLTTGSGGGVNLFEDFALGDSDAAPDLAESLERNREEALSEFTTSGW